MSTTVEEVVKEGIDLGTLQVDDNGAKARKPDPAVLDIYPVAHWPWPRIAVYVPLLPCLPNAPRVFHRFIGIANQGAPFIGVGYGEIAMQRCKAADYILDSHYTHVLMLDHDHEHPFDIVQLLARRVIEDPRRLVVGGLVFRRSAPYDPALYLRDDKGNYYSATQWDRDIVEVDALSTACVLIHRSVFEHLERPWFFYDYTGAAEGGPGWRRPTEDINFCKKARAAGIRLFVDTTVCSPHLPSDAPAVDEEYWRRYVEEHGHDGPLKSIEEIINNGKG